MNDVMDRSFGEPLTTDAVGTGVFDCDIHPALRSACDLLPFLSERWKAHLLNYGSHVKQPLLFTTPYPRSAPSLARRDAWPPAGGPPGSDLAFTREQHLDALDIRFGILQVLDMGCSPSRTSSSAPPRRPPSTTGSSKSGRARSRG